MVNLMLHSLQPSPGVVNFILAQLYVGVNTALSSHAEVAFCTGQRAGTHF